MLFVDGGEAIGWTTLLDKKRSEHVQNGVLAPLEILRPWLSHKYDFSAAISS